MPVKLTIEGGQVPVKVWTEDVDSQALKQLENVARLHIIHHHVAAMPDVHTGLGATIGSVIPTYKAIIPAAVGVDIGCGMIAAKTSLRAEQLDEKLLKSIFSSNYSRCAGSAYSGRNWTRFPVETGHEFQMKLDTVSG